jgi:hypothetical protein
VLGVVFFVVAAAAPLAGMTGTVPLAIAAGSGAGAPGAYVAVGIILLLFSSGYSAMSQVVTNSGAFFAYVGRGMGLPAGVGAALTSVLAYITVQLAIYGFLGGLLAHQMEATFGLSAPWWAWSLIAWLVVLGLSVLSVDVGARVLGLLMVCELASLVLVAAAVFARGGGPEGLSLEPSFAPANVLVGSITGSAGIAFACAFASYIGRMRSATGRAGGARPRRPILPKTAKPVINRSVVPAVSLHATGSRKCG